MSGNIDRKKDIIEKKIISFFQLVFECCNDEPCPETLREAERICRSHHISEEFIWEYGKKKGEEQEKEKEVIEKKITSFLKLVTKGCDDSPCCATIREARAICYRHYIPKEFIWEYVKAKGKKNEK